MPVVETKKIEPIFLSPKSDKDKSDEVKAVNPNPFLVNQENQKPNPFIKSPEKDSKNPFLSNSNPSSSAVNLFKKAENAPIESSSNPTISQPISLFQKPNDQKEQNPSLSNPPQP